MVQCVRSNRGKLGERVESGLTESLATASLSREGNRGTTDEIGKRHALNFSRVGDASPAKILHKNLVKSIGAKRGSLACQFSPPILTHIEMETGWDLRHPPLEKRGLEVGAP